MRPRPRAPIALLRAFLPPAERDEITADLIAEHETRSRAGGRAAADAWLWAQALRSIPDLARQIWRRARTGFDSRANVMNPGGPPIERWMLDARYATRRLRTRPTYTALAVITLALGVGGVAAISGIIRALLVAPLPYPHSEQLAHFWSAGDWEAREFAALRQQWSGFSAVAAYHTKDVTLERDGAPTRLIQGNAATSELFRTLEVAPRFGRTFAVGDDTPQSAPVVVLSNALWRDLGADQSIVGSRIRLDGVSRTVIGVMPPDFWFPDPATALWMPEPIDPKLEYGMYTLIGRVAPGQHVRQMDPYVGRITRTLRTLFEYSPQWDKTRHASLRPLREEMVGGMRPAILATFAAMTVILLIACANVAALVLGQVESRATEFALRAALGADRSRLTAQIAAEVLALGLCAGLLGTVLATSGFRVLRDALPLGAWSRHATLDWTVFAITMAVAVLSSLGIALFPIVVLWRRDLRGALAGPRSGGLLRKHGGFQGVMVVGEVALAVLLACAAGLLARSVGKLYSISPGIDTRGIAVIDLAAPTSLGTEQRHALLQSVVRALAALPGVRSAAVTQRVPLRGSGWTMGLRIVDLSADVPSPYFRMVSRDYFSTLGIALRRGRLFDTTDRPTDSTTAIIVNESLVRIFFPATDPIGQVMPGGFGRPERIVGVVADVAEGRLTDAPAPARYYLAEQIGFVPDGETIVMRMARPDRASGILPDARRVIGRIAPSVAVQEATTMERVFDEAVGPARDLMTLLALLTGIALTLGAIGIYGVISQFVGRRRREWSIRVALGLAPVRVLALVVGHGASLVAIGIAIGVAAALVLARLLSVFLYGVTSTDPVALASASAALMAVGFIAALGPALRASRTDPALTLREQ